MAGAWAIVAACAAAGILAGIFVARRTIARRMAAMPAGIAERCTAAHAMRRDAMRFAMIPSIVAPPAGAAAALIARGVEPDSDIVFLTMFAAAFACTFSIVPSLLDAEAVLQGPGWNRRATARLWTWGLLVSNGVAAWVGAVLATAVATWWGPRPHATWLVAEAFALGGLAGLLVQSRCFLTVAKAEPFDGGVAEEAGRLAGAGPPIEVQLWRTGRGAWNAFALAARRRRQILVSEDLAALLPRDQMLGILLHETGHHRLRHLGIRKLAVLGGVVGVPVAFAAAGTARPFWMMLASIFFTTIVTKGIYARQEAAADAFAASRGLAEPLGRALVAMERAKLVPGTERVALSHPSLRDRLVKLGLDADALLRGDGPAAVPAAAPPEGVTAGVPAR